MARIVVHAGMPKTGSSSIQEWLRNRAASLVAEGITPLRASVRRSGEVLVGGPEALANMNSGRVGRHARDHPEHAEGVAAAFFEQLDRAARRSRIVVVSSEGWAQWFWHGDELFLAGFDRLAASHDVEVAYYARPQHTALEAAWRQWGFRTDQPPSRFLRGRSRHVEHLRTLRLVRELAPDVRFAVRPFRRDLLAGGNVVVDFARTFLGVEVPGGDDPGLWRNRGLPLELVNALHGAPAGLLWPADEARWVNPALEVMRRVADGLDLPASEEVELSRLVLQQACHERFEADNLRLISELGWETEEWVPAVADDIGEASYARLDELWRPRASAAELEVLRGALALLLEDTRAEGRTGE